MRLLALVLVCALVVEDGGSVDGRDSALRPRGTGAALSAFRRRTPEDLAADPTLCFSVRENEEQRQLLCNERRSKFNYNPFGLRFGKRFPHRGAAKRGRTNTSSARSLFLRELEVPI